MLARRRTSLIVGLPGSIDIQFSFSEAITGNLFAELAAIDYRQFSRDFDENLLEALPVSRDAAWNVDIDEMIGDCLSREV